MNIYFPADIRDSETPHTLSVCWFYHKGLSTIYSSSISYLTPVLPKPENISTTWIPTAPADTKTLMHLAEVCSPVSKPLLYSSLRHLRRFAWSSTTSHPADKRLHLHALFSVCLYSDSICCLSVLDFTASRFRPRDFWTPLCLTPLANSQYAWSVQRCWYI